MTSRDFIYWAQGFFEVSEAKTMSERQVDIFKNHLNLVFKHEIDPAMGDEATQIELKKVHDGPQYKPGTDTLFRC